MKFIICALWFNPSWKHTTFSNPNGEHLMYCEDEGEFISSVFTELDEATEYSYDTAVNKMEELKNSDIDIDFRQYGLVIMSKTFIQSKR